MSRQLVHPLHLPLGLQCTMHLTLDTRSSEGLLPLFLNIQPCVYIDYGRVRQHMVRPHIAIESSMELWLCVCAVEAPQFGPSKLEPMDSSSMAHIHYYDGSRCTDVYLLTSRPCRFMVMVTEPLSSCSRVGAAAQHTHTRVKKKESRRRWSL